MEKRNRLTLPVHMWTREWLQSYYFGENQLYATMHFTSKACDVDISSPMSNE